MAKKWLPLLTLLLIPTLSRADFTIKDVRRAYTPWGPERPTAEYYVSGDQIIMPFILHGIDLSTPASIQLDLGMALIDSRGKTTLARTIPMKGKPTLQGRELWAVAILNIPAGLAEGDYTFRVTVESSDGSRSAQFERSIQLKEPELTVRIVRFYYDKKYTVPAGARFLLGQNLYFRAQVIGLDDLNGMYRISQSFAVVDPKTKKELHIRESGPQAQNIGRPGATWNMSGNTGLLTRTGKFLLRIKATDEVANKTVVKEIPFEVTK